MVRRIVTPNVPNVSTGTLKDKYDVKEVLGSGAHGTAFLANRISDGETVVVKRVRIADLSQHEQEEVLGEAGLLSHFNHPNIIKYYESIVEDEDIHIVMEYADGGELIQLVEDRNSQGKDTSENELMLWFVQMALALWQVHTHNVIHRDIKPQNIFVSAQGKLLKLGDFGVARAMRNSVEMRRTQIGTPYYLSPEICQDRPYNHKSDVWALGCVLYELATGRRPFEGGNLPAVMLKILWGKPKPLPARFSTELKALVDRMLTQDPEARPSMDDVLRDRFVRHHLHRYIGYLNANHEGLADMLGLDDLQQGAAAVPQAAAAAAARPKRAPPKRCASNPAGMMALAAATAAGAGIPALGLMAAGNNFGNLPSIGGDTRLRPTKPQPTQLGAGPTSPTRRAPAAGGAVAGKPAGSPRSAAFQTPSTPELPSPRSPTSRGVMPPLSPRLAFAPAVASVGPAGPLDASRGRTPRFQETDIFAAVPLESPPIRARAPRASETDAFGPVPPESPPLQRARAPRVSETDAFAPAPLESPPLQRARAPRVSETDAFAPAPLESPPLQRARAPRASETDAFSPAPLESPPTQRARAPRVSETDAFAPAPLESPPLQRARAPRVSETDAFAPAPLESPPMQRARAPRASETDAFAPAPLESPPMQRARAPRVSETDVFAPGPPESPPLRMRAPRVSETDAFAPSPLESPPLRTRAPRVSETDAFAPWDAPPLRTRVPRFSETDSTPSSCQSTLSGAALPSMPGGLEGMRLRTPRVSEVDSPGGLPAEGSWMRNSRGFEAEGPPALTSTPALLQRKTLKKAPSLQPLRRSIQTLDLPGGGDGPIPRKGRRTSDSAAGSGPGSLAGSGSLPDLLNAVEVTRAVQGKRCW